MSNSHPDDSKNEDSKKSRVWKPTSDERIEWNHPYIQITRFAPGYLVQELYGYADSSWEKWLRENHVLVDQKNRKPWIALELLGRATSGETDEEDSGRSVGDGT